MIKIGVSACLMGQNVRYDGNNKYVNLIEYFDSKTYELSAICPEVEMGLSIPRPPIQIINHKNQIQLVQVDNENIDYTHAMRHWFNQSIKRLTQFHGFILKSKSPSCGNQTTIHHSNDYNQSTSDGLFVMALKQQFNHPNIIDEVNLKNPQQLSVFKDYLQSLSQSNPL